MRIFNNVFISLLTILIISSAAILNCWSESVPKPDVSKYEYQQTRDLIGFVHNAAELFAEKGEKAFPEFRKKGGKWFRKQRYIFMYDLNGVTVFHPVDPELEGKNLINMKDLDGKPMIKYIIEAVTEGDKPYGWVHYLWAEPGEIFPRWKSSYVLKVESPSGKEYVIGSGIYNVRPEKQFIVDAVDLAVERIKKGGKSAFHDLDNKSSKFVFGNTYVFVLTIKGKAIVDPAFPSISTARNMISGRELIDFTDAVGKYTVREMISKLKHKDSAWVLYLWPKMGETIPSRKIAYVRKIKIDGEEYIVGSDIFLENPIWMKF